MRNGEQTVDQSIAKCLDFLHFGKVINSALHCRCQSTDIGYIFGTAALTSFLSATIDQIANANAFFDIKSADSLGGMNFMTREAKHIHAKRLDIDRNRANRLYGIGEHKRALGMCNLGNLADRLKRADLIICHHNCHKRGIIIHNRTQLVHIQNAARIHADIHHLKAVLSKRLAGVKYCVMLDLACYDLFAASCGISGSFDRPVVRLRTAGSKVELGRLATDRRRNFFAGLVEQLLSLLSVCMQTRRVSPCIGEARHHCLDHLF